MALRLHVAFVPFSGSKEVGGEEVRYMRGGTLSLVVTVAVVVLLVLLLLQLL